MRQNNNFPDIVLLNRAKGDGISIQKVFDILTPHIRNTHTVSHEYMEIPGLGIRQLLSNLFKSYKLRKRGRITHITGAIHYLSYVLIKKQTVTTVHDLGMITHEKPGALKKILMKLLFVYPLKCNRYIICISEKTKKEVLDLIKYPESNIVVIPDPVSDRYIYSPKEFCSSYPRILHIGTKENKNLKRTIRALKGLNVHLHIVGKLSSSDIEELETNRVRYSSNYNLTEDELLVEYQNCDILSMVSTNEGFGMPIIEAQSIGRVCVTSNIEPMKSVAGSGAKLVNPYDEDAIRQAFVNIIDNTIEREELIRLGLENSCRFSAESIAKAYCDVYHKVIN